MMNTTSRDIGYRYSVSCLVVAIATIGATSRTLAEETRAEIAKDDEKVTVKIDGRPVMEYRHGNVPFKPCAAKLYTPGGVQILRDSPHDHKHHHALMFALKADGVDFWSESPGCGSQESQGVDAVESEAANGRTVARFAQDLAWTKPEQGETVLTERRAIEVERLDDPSPVTLLTWRGELSVPPGKDAVELAGSHYFGLGMRFVESMDKGGRFMHSTGEPGPIVRGTERLTPNRWCAYTAEVDGKPVTVALFDHPKNPRHPNKMFTMTEPFAYLSATLNLWKEPLSLKPDRPLVLCHGVALWDGTVEPAEIESVYRKWIADRRVAP
ncbi:MAG TPA: hypothetical protein DD670_17880 [Planctomycetaceae bacterium]|nr:hypothetical protein [Planctomycetaceae bacterium]